MAPPSITDVARAAGVGVGTVSRVLNQAPHVSVATAELVRQAMERLGYQPPPPDQRRGPRRRGPSRRPQLGLLELLILGPFGLRWFMECAPVYAAVVDGIERAAARLGWELVVNQATDWTRLRTLAPSRRHVGRIVLATHDADDDMPDEAAALPTVWVMGTPHRFRGDHVQPDHMRIGILAAQHAIACGHRRCAYLGTVLGSPGFQVGWRGDAFRWTVERAGGSVAVLIHPGLLVASPEHNRPDEVVLAHLLDQLRDAAPAPTALMLQSDLLAPSVYRQLRERGVRPQLDLAIITCNNEPSHLAALHPAPAVVDIQAALIGERAADQLDWRIRHPDEPAVRIMVQPIMRKA